MTAPVRYEEQFAEVDRARLAGPELAHPSAAVLVGLAHAQAVREQFVAPRELAPLYLRGPDAQKTLGPERAMSELRIEPLRRRHIAAVARIERQVSANPWSADLFRGELALPEASRCYRVARRGGRVVGFGGLMFVLDEAHVTTLAVAAGPPGRPHRHPAPAGVGAGGRRPGARRP